MDNRVTAASAAAPIAVAAPPRLVAQVQPFPCVTLTQDTGFNPREWRVGRDATPGLRSVRLAGMAGTDPADEITALTSTLDSIEAVLDPGEMQKEAADLRLQAADPELWTDPDRGQKVTRRLSYLDAELTRLTNLRQRQA